MLQGGLKRGSVAVSCSDVAAGSGGVASDGVKMTGGTAGTRVSGGNLLHRRLGDWKCSSAFHVRDEPLHFFNVSIGLDQTSRRHHWHLTYFFIQYPVPFVHQTRTQCQQI